MSMSSDDSTAKVLDSYKKGNIAELADAMGVAYSTLQRQLNEYDTYLFPVTQLIGLVKFTGNFAIMDHLEARLGRVAISLPEKGRPIDGAAYASFVKESGEALSAMSEAMVDGRITSEEAKRIRKDLSGLIGVASLILSNLPD